MGSANNVLRLCFEYAFAFLEDRHDEQEVEALLGEAAHDHEAGREAATTAVETSLAVQYQSWRQRLRLQDRLAPPLARGANISPGCVCGYDVEVNIEFQNKCEFPWPDVKILSCVVTHILKQL